MATDSQCAPQQSPDALENEQDKLKDAFTLKILLVIRDAQQQHGLRHGDHQRYRGYCSRRLRRIRKSLHFTCGNHKKFVRKEVSAELLKDVRYLYIPLFCAERSWAYAVQLGQEANSEARKRFHQMRRLKKAVGYAEQLNAVCQSDRCDARTKLEAQAYLASMSGLMCFELHKWQESLQHYSQAKMIYERLASAVADEAAIYDARCEELAPSLRYCAYKIGDQSAIKDLEKMRNKSGAVGEIADSLATLINQTRERLSVTLSEVKWRGRTVPVKSEKVRLFLLGVNDLDKEIQQSTDPNAKVSQYESLLQSSIDALQALRDELNADPEFKAQQRGQKVEGQLSNTHFLYVYASYLRLTKTLERNLVLIEMLQARFNKAGQDEGQKTVKPQDLVRLYDSVIQNLNDMAALPGLDEDGAFQKEASNRVVGYRAFRCFYIGQAYSYLKKWKETVALYDRARTYAQQGIKELRPFAKDATVKAQLASLEALLAKIDESKFSVQASTVLEADGGPTRTGPLSEEARAKPLLERLDLFGEDASLLGKNPTLVTLPPSLQSIPCKPLFFDLADGHIELPDLSDKVEQKKAAQPAGLTGFVRNLWSWGGKK